MYFEAPHTRRCKSAKRRINTAGLRHVDDFGVRGRLVPAIERYNHLLIGTKFGAPKVIFCARSQNVWLKYIEQKYNFLMHFIQNIDIMLTLGHF